jgi:hypothetical protein
MAATARRTTGRRVRQITRAAGAFLATMMIVGLGVLAVGRLANTPTAAMGLTVGWFVVSLVGAALAVSRRRGLAVAVATGYLAPGCGPHLRPRLAGLPGGDAVALVNCWAPVSSTVASATPR